MGGYLTAICYKRNVGGPKKIFKEIQQIANVKLYDENNPGHKTGVMLVVFGSEEEYEKYVKKVYGTPLYHEKLDYDASRKRYPEGIVFDSTLRKLGLI